MAKLKRVCTVLFVVICMVVMPVFQAYATNADDGIMPAMEYINSADITLVFENSEAIIAADVRGYPSVTKCEVNIELQEKGLLFWREHDSWLCGSFSRSLNTEVYSNVTPGKKYRVVATITVWSGTDSETQTITTDSVTAVA